MIFFDKDLDLCQKAGERNSLIKKYLVKEISTLTTFGCVSGLLYKSID